MPDHRQLSRNIWTSWVGYALRIVISFLFVPYITATLGDARYGVWVLVFQTINYFVLLDFGLEKALLRFISKYLGTGQFGQINKVLGATFRLYLFAGSLIIVGSWLAATFLFDFFRIGDPSLLSEGKTALVIIGVYMGMRFYLLPFAGSLGGFQRFDISNLLHMLEDLLRTLIMVALLASGYGLVPLAVAILGMSTLKQIAAIIWLKRLYPQVRIFRSTSDRTTTRELLDYSRVTFGITLAWLVIFNTDAVLLGLLSSAAAAGVYAPGAQLMLYLRNAVNVIASPLTTRVSELESHGDLDGIRRIYLKGLAYTSYLSFFMTVGVVVYARPFVMLWLPPEFEASSEVMRILAIGSAFFVPQIIGNAVLFGIDRHGLILQVLVVESVTKIAFSLLLIPKYGLIGMACAAALPQLVLYLTMYPILISRALGLSVIHILMSGVRSGFLAMFATLPVAVLIRTIVPPFSWGAFIINVLTVSLAASVGGWFVLAPSDRARIKNQIRRDSHAT
ncbi:MAG: oligosaccharide flippase family protein [Candidatus Zixiibacteriota bacterium]